MDESEAIPESERETYTLPIPVGTRHRGAIAAEDKINIEVTETVCQWLVFHDGVQIDGISITHASTGFMVMHGLPSVYVARLCAGAISKIFPWSIALESERVTLEKRMKVLPVNLQTWIKKWSEL